jgi:hypothetical protein
MNVMVPVQVRASVERGATRRAPKAMLGTN